MSDSSELPPDPAAWEAHTCVRCAKAFMLQLGGDGVAATCPHCGAPASLTTRRSAPGEFALLTTPRGRQTRSRRKRKIHSEDDLAWDAQANDTQKQGQISEFLTRTTRFPGKVRLKRVRRKKLPTRWAKLSAKLGAWSIAVIVVTSAGLIYFAMHTLFVVAATDTDKSKRPSVDLSPAAETLDAEGVPTIVTPGEKDACLAVANAFYAARTVEQKLLHVRQPERVRPLMERWYEARGHSRVEIDAVLLEKKYAVGGRRFISLAVELAAGAQQIISFEQTGDSQLRLDWEVSVGYQLVPLAEFRSARPPTATPFRVKVKMGNDYRAPFEDEEKFQCVRLTYPGDKGFQLTGYIDRSAPWAAAFIAKLELASPSVILALRFPQGAASDAHVEVVELIHESWYY